MLVVKRKSRLKNLQEHRHLERFTAAGQFLRYLLAVAKHHSHIAADYYENMSFLKSLRM
jgi:hypothetical protein